ncbi:uncharacterized protein K02A2.6-like [Dermacentor silvarum]|uniref:uncharacterized protein K02A2.6-like n=1 Tax=Dermacentor silvarum TaxID=543639 RepID=UPI001897C518|nr:uncharacterized protein K02A2.6-like [Dermacentor silvarum]
MPDGRENDAQQAAAAGRQNDASFFNPFAVELPEKLDFRDPNEWKRWIARWCGSTQQHFKKQCPAFGKLCNNCGKTGHYAKVCLSGRQQPIGQRAFGSSTKKSRTANTEEVFLGEVSETDTLEPEARPEFSQLFTGLGKMKTVYKVTLKANATPYAVTTPRRVAVPLQPKVEQELRRMKDLGVIQQVYHATPWCAPMVISAKQNGEIRICIDYTELNRQLIRERVIMPTVEENLAKLANAKVFSKLDANSGYWQTPLAPESQDLTTFITPFGRFQFLRLPFGIATAPEFFQREMLRILEGLPGIACHQDDVVVYGKNQVEHNANLTALLQRLKGAGMTLNPHKCEFSKRRVKFLGHILNEAGIAGDQEKTEAIRKMPLPENTTELRSFLGMVNQLAKFLPGLAENTKPLRDLLLDEAVWVWHQTQQEAFYRVKDDLTTKPVLCYYDSQRPLTISADASSYGLGAVLLQTNDGKRQPVAYASRAMTPTEQKYAQVEKEALAITWACERFRMYVLGLQFSIETDHKPLVPLFSTKRIDEMTPRLQRFRMRVLEYDFTISHIPGKDMHTADVLSRKPLQCSGKHLASVIEEYELLTIEQLPASTEMLNRSKIELQKDATTSLVMHYCTTKWPKAEMLAPEVRKYASVADELSVVQGLLLRGTRIVFPPSLRKEVLQRLRTGHQGVVRCRARARESSWWPAISQDVETYVRRCATCTKHRPVANEDLLQTPIPERPWQVVGTDLFHHEGRNYIVAVDYYSRFFELEELCGTQTKHVVQFLSNLFARYGITDILRSDNGPQYSSLEFLQFMSSWGVRHVTSSPHYAQSNGEAERAVQTAKNIIRESTNVAECLFVHRATPGPEGYSPAELLMGRKLKTNVPTLPEILEPKWEYQNQFQAKQ